MAIAFKGTGGYILGLSLWDCTGILYGSTPTIISLRLESGGQRGPSGFDSGTMQGALSRIAVSTNTNQRNTMSLSLSLSLSHVHLELWDFSRASRRQPRIARAIELLSPWGEHR